jgi:hypothetical protein
LGVSRQGAAHQGDHLIQPQAPRQIVRLYEDALTYYRRPTLAQDYTPAGSDAPHAQQGQGSNTTRRIAACPDVETGRLVAWQWHADLLAGLHGSKITLVALPTYAPWLNPVEKVWRKWYQEVLHLHPWVNAWDEPGWILHRAVSMLARAGHESPQAQPGEYFPCA